VVFERGKMRQIALQHKRWHLILDRLSGLRCRLLHSRSYSLQNLLNIWWEAGDVFINRFGCCLIRFHGVILSRLISLAMPAYYKSVIANQQSNFLYQNT